MVSRQGVSRRSQRIAARLTVTANFVGDAGALVCRTRDVSDVGLFLETPAVIDPGTRAEISLLDDEVGQAIQLEGEVVRCLPGGMGIRLDHPPEAWMDLLGRVRSRDTESTTALKLRRQRRLRILVVGDDDRRKAALALYVTSGWDVRFAADLGGAEEALGSFKIDAIIVEHDLDDERWPAIMLAARASQPGARRIVRSRLKDVRPPPAGRAVDLVHRVVDLKSGLEAVVDALTAQKLTIDG